MKQKKLFGLISLIVLVLFQLYFTGCEKTEELLNPADKSNIGDSVWVHILPQGNKTHYIDGRPLAIGQNGTIYYTAGGGQANWDPIQVYAVNKSDGSLKWKSEPLQSWHTNSNIVVGDDGSVYVSSGTMLYSLSQTDGSVNWIWEVPQALNNVSTYGELGPLSLANDGNLITKTTGGGSYYRALYCIGIDGAIKWYRFIGSESTPISIGNAGTIFDFEHDNTGNILTASNPDDGSLLWTLRADLSNSWNNIMIYNNDVFTLMHTDTLVRIDPANHQIIWKREAKTYQDYKYMDADGNIILFDQFTGSYIYNPTNGSLINGGLGLPHLISIDSKNQIYGVISDSNPHLSVTDEGGNIIWENVTNGIMPSTIAISDDNVVYIANGAEILALKTDAGLPHSGWPRYTHDNRNTCNINKW